MLGRLTGLLMPTGHLLPLGTHTGGGGGGGYKHSDPQELRFHGRASRPGGAEGNRCTTSLIGGRGCLGKKGDSHHPSPANAGILQPTAARSSFLIFSQEAKTPDFYVKCLDF